MVRILVTTGSVHHIIYCSDLDKQDTKAKDSNKGGEADTSANA